MVVQILNFVKMLRAIKFWRMEAMPLNQDQSAAFQYPISCEKFHCHRKTKPAVTFLNHHIGRSKGAF